MATLLTTWSTYNIRSGTSTPNSVGDGNGVISVYLESQNNAANTSYIRIDHKLRLRKDITSTLSYNVTSSYRANQGSYGGTYQSLTVPTAGTERSHGTSYTDYTATLGSTYHTVTHNADGTGRLYVNGSIEANVLRVNGTAYTGTRTSSFNVALPTIPRASTVTATNANIESASTISITSASASFTHTLKYEFGALTGTIVEKTTSTSYAWTVPTTFYAQIPNATSGTCTITCETYSGTTLIGTPTTTTFVASTSEALCKPTVTATITDTNATTVALTGNNQTLVKFFSNANVVITATPKNSATISSYSVVCGDGKSATTANSTLNAVESGSFTIFAKDSRNYQTYTTPNPATRTMVNYIKLTNSATFYRTEPTNDTIAVVFSGNYFNSTFGATANTLTIKYKWREVGAASWESDVTLTENTDYKKSGNTYFSGTGTSAGELVLGTSFDYTKKYEFEIWAIDKLYTGTTIKSTATVAQGLPVLGILENSLETNGDIIVKGTIRGSKNLFNKVDIVSGSYLNSNGTIANNASWCYSNYIYVKGLTNITLGYANGNLPSTCFYDADKNYISGVAHSNIAGTKTFDVPSTAVYCRTSELLASIDTTQLEPGSTATTYEAYNTPLIDNVVDVLTSTSTTQSLSANQGKELNDRVILLEAKDIVVGTSTGHIDTGTYYAKIASCAFTSGSYQDAEFIITVLGGVNCSGSATISGRVRRTNNDTTYLYNGYTTGFGELLAANFKFYTNGTQVDIYCVLPTSSYRYIRPIMIFGSNIVLSQTSASTTVPSGTATAFA
jgi:hypothetical protein